MTARQEFGGTADNVSRDPADFVVTPLDGVRSMDTNAACGITSGMRDTLREAPPRPSRERERLAPGTA